MRSDLTFIFVSLELDQQLLRQVENVWARVGSTSPTGPFWWWVRCWKDATLIPGRLYIPDIWRTAGESTCPWRMPHCFMSGCWMWFPPASPAASCLSGSLRQEIQEIQQYTFLYRQVCLWLWSLHFTSTSALQLTLSLFTTDVRAVPGVAQWKPFFPVYHYSCYYRSDKAVWV